MRDTNVKKNTFSEEKCATVTEKEKPVFLELQRLGEIAYILQKSIEVLSSRLMPIKNSRPIVEREPGKEPEGCSDITLAIRKIGYVLEDANDVIQNNLNTWRFN
jgi:hypothetical protein